MSETRRKKREDATVIAQRLLARAKTRLTVVKWVLRITGLIMLFIYMAYLYSAFSEPGKIFTWNNIVLFIIIIILTLILILIEILTLPAWGIYAILPSTSALYVYSIRLFILDFLFKGLSTPPMVDKQKLLQNLSPFAPLAYLYDKPIRDQWVHPFLYALITLMFLGVLLSGTAFAFQNEVKLAGYAFALGQIMLTIAYMNNLLIPLSLNPKTLSSLFGSSMFVLALVSYLYFEYSLQTGYVGNLLNPTVSRQKRVTKALERLEKFRLGVTSEKAEKKKESESKESELHKTQKAVASAGSTLAKKYGATAIVYLSEQASDTLFAKEGGEQEKLTGRLQRYHDGLLRGDPSLDAKLAGATQKLNPVAILSFAGGSLLLRLIFVIFFTWFILNPSTFMSYVGMDPSVSNSIEINQPEGILLVLTPIVISIIALGWIIGKIQDVGKKGIEETILEEQVTQYIRKLQKETAARRAGVTLQEKEALLTEKEPPKRTTTRKTKKGKRPVKSSKKPPKKKK